METKTYFKIPVLLLTIGILASCSTDNDWKIFGLKGKVKTYTETHYNVENVDGEWVQGDSIMGNVITRVSFDDKGQRLYSEIFNADTKLVAKIVPVREKGVVIEEEQYDKDGILTSKISINHLSKEDNECITYDKNGNELSQSKSYVSYDADKKLNYRTTETEGLTTVQELDKDGRMLSQKHTYKNVDFSNFQTYEYIAFDKHKNWTKLLGYEPEVGKEPRFIVVREYEYY